MRRAAAMQRNPRSPRPRTVSMSQQVTLPQVAALARQLAPPERKRLAERILQELTAQETAAAPPRRRFWREIRGALPCGLHGEDAQAWVSRSRAELGEPR